MSIKNFKDFLKESNSENPQQHKYMMLSRLQSDCEYFLGNGKGSERNLYYKNVPDHIAEMKRLWNELVEKPEWLSMEDIERYEDQMLNYTEEEVVTSAEDKDVQGRLDKIRQNQINERND